MQYNITYRQKDKGWQYIISVKDESGKWKQKSKQGFKTKRAAQKAADERLGEIKKEIMSQINTSYKNITFKQFADIYLEHEKLYKDPNTVRHYKFAIQKFKKLYNMELNEIETLHIQDCVDDALKEGLSPTTLSVYVGRIKTMFKRSVEVYKIRADSPVKNIQIPQNKKEEKIKALTKAQFNDLLSKISYRKYYIASLIAGTCGLRLGEILGLTWADIDFFNATIEVNKQWKRLKDGKWGFGTVKSKNSNRTVPVPPNTLKELQKYKKEFPTDIHNRVILYTASTNLSTALAQLYKRIGYNISVHDLRHTYATMLIANGVDFKTVARLLGHDVKETMNTYSHVTDDMIENAAKTINRIF